MQNLKDSKKEDFISVGNLKKTNIEDTVLKQFDLLESEAKAFKSS